MIKKRVRVPSKIAARVDYASNLLCCVCRKTGEHLHHIDGNPSNNTEDNLALLCFKCHNEASLTGSLSRKLTSETIILFRKEHYTRVARRRHVPPFGSSHPRVDSRRLRSKRTTASDDHLHELMLEAIRVDAVEKIDVQIEASGWEGKERLLDSLHPYADYLRPSRRVREAILSTCYHLSCRTRDGMSASIASSLAMTARAALPMTSLVGPSHYDLADSPLFRVAIDIGFTIAYDGACYLGNFKVIDAGSDLLRAILRFCHLNHLRTLKADVRQRFSDLRKHTTKNESATKWLNYQEADALAPNPPWPEYPRDIPELLSR
jgi:hypothetical protein